MIKEEENVINLSLRNYNSHNWQEVVKRLQENLKMTELQETLRNMKTNFGELNLGIDDE